MYHNTFSNLSIHSIRFPGIPRYFAPQILARVSRHGGSLARKKQFATTHASIQVLPPSKLCPRNSGQGSIIGPSQYFHRLNYLSHNRRSFSQSLVSLPLWRPYYPPASAPAPNPAIHCIAPQNCSNQIRNEIQYL
jgi:hypothetical protein